MALPHDRAQRITGVAAHHIDRHGRAALFGRRFCGENGTLWMKRPGAESGDGGEQHEQAEAIGKAHGPDRDGDCRDAQKRYEPASPPISNPAEERLAHPTR